MKTITILAIVLFSSAVFADASPQELVNGRGNKSYMKALELLIHIADKNTDKNVTTQEAQPVIETYKEVKSPGPIWDNAFGDFQKATDPKNVAWARTIIAETRTLMMSEKEITKWLTDTKFKGDIGTILKFSLVVCFLRGEIDDLCDNPFTSTWANGVCNMVENLNLLDQGIRPKW